ncbi:MAG: phage gp6-like head-tail connector protein [Ignavibacteriae bacterium]|nr:phage gp6-like head-tail connector protein [Ignavibacteriota bacterium]
MLTETTKKFIGGVAGTESSEEPLVTYALPNGQYADYKFEGIQVPKYYDSIASIKIFYKRQHAGDLYLRFKTAHIDVDNPPASSIADSDSYTAYAGGGVDEKIASLTVPTVAYDGLTAITAGDVLAIKIERDAANASDTYESDFQIAFVEIVFNVEAAASGENDIVSLSELKSYLRKTDTNQDNFLQDWITIVSGQIERYCDRKFRAQTISNEIHDGDGTNRLYTHYFPIAGLAGQSDVEKLSSLQFSNTPDDEWEDIEINIDHIFIDEHKPYIELYDEIFPAGRRNIRVSYFAGYATVPEDVKRMACEMCAMVWKESNAGGIFQLGEAFRRTEESGTEFTKEIIDLDARWKSVLDRYRKVSV